MEEKKKKILVVDDEEGSLEMAEIRLKEFGYEAITATNGKDGLRMAEKECPDLILLDVMMPEMDGGEIAYLLSENPKTKDIPIIFLTSLVSEREEFKRAKGYLFVAKPFDKEKLLRVIKEAL